MRKYLGTIYPVKFLMTTHTHLTLLYVSMLHRRAMIPRALEHTPTYHLIMTVKKPTDTQRTSLLQLN